jgi:glycosyltransferase involved in cell wall biosynthesis
VKVLISAYACRPGWGSEPGTGWSYARMIADRHDVWVITKSDNREAIERAGLPEDRPRFVYVDAPAPAALVSRLPYGAQLRYVAWQRAAGRAAAALHARVGFDLVHHVTFAADWMPAGVLRLPGVPAVWGPVGGTTGMARGLWRWLGWRGVVQEVAREGLTRPMRLLHGRAAARRASLVLAQNNDVAARFSRWSRRTVVLPHVIVEPPPATAPAPAPGSGRLALFVARLIPWKGLCLAVAALAEPGARDWRLEVIGEGPERARAERLARRLGVSGRVLFRGRQPRDAVLAAMSRADALLAPSMHEAGGWAVAEAVAHGCPVVCLDRGGPAVLVTEGRGVRVPVTRYLPRDLARALASLRGRVPPTDRWSRDRVRERVEELYALALGTAPVRGA